MNDKKMTWKEWCEGNKNFFSSIELPNEFIKNEKAWWNMLEKEIFIPNTKAAHIIDQMSPEARGIFWRLILDSTKMFISNLNPNWIKNIQKLIAPQAEDLSPVVVFDATFCPGCGVLRYDGYKNTQIRVLSMNATKGGWIAKGSGKPRPCRHQCDYMANEVLHAVPLETSTYVPHVVHMMNFNTI